MIISRLALFFGLFFAVATTQVPEYMQQYRQRLGGAIDELSAIVTQFDTESAVQGLTEADAIARLQTNSDQLARERGAAMTATIARLAKLQRSAAALENPNQFARWEGFAATFDARVAARAYETYQPAVPTTADGFVAGLIGFLIGGGLVHLLGLPIRYRHKLFRRRSGAGPLLAGASGSHDNTASTARGKNQDRQRTF